MAVVAELQPRTADPRLAEAIADALPSSSPSLLGTEFVTDGAFDMVFEGDPTRLRQLAIDDYAEHLLLVRETQEWIPDSKSRLRPVVTLSVREYDSRTGSLVWEDRVESKVIGPSDIRALANARMGSLEDIIERLKNRAPRALPPD